MESRLQSQKTYRSQHIHELLRCTPFQLQYSLLVGFRGHYLLEEVQDILFILFQSFQNVRAAVDSQFR